MGNPFERINPVREAISTYRDVNDIFRQERADTRAEEDRQYNRQRQAIADQRADDTHRVAMESADEQRKQRQLADDDRILGSANMKVKQFEMNRMRDPYTTLPEFDDAEQTVIKKYLAANPTLSNDPLKLKEQALAGRRLNEELTKVAPQLINGDRKSLRYEQAPQLFQDANIFLAQELNKGADKYGNNDSRKELVAVYSDEKNNLRWGVKVTPKDPSQPSYETFITDMRNADDGEAAKATPILYFDQYMKANTDFANTAATFFASAQAKAGDKDVTKEIQTQLNNEAVKFAQKRVEEFEKANGKLTYDQQRRLFTEAMPRGVTLSASDQKKFAEELYPKPEKRQNPDVKSAGTGKPGEEQLVEIVTGEDGRARAIPIKGTVKKPKPEKPDRTGERTAKEIRDDINRSSAEYQRERMAYNKKLNDPLADKNALADEGAVLEQKKQALEMKSQEYFDLTGKRYLPGGVNPSDRKPMVEGKDAQGNRMVFDPNDGGLYADAGTSKKKGAAGNQGGKIEIKQSFNKGDVVLATDGNYYKKTPQGYVKAQVKGGK